jgi:hypothetical protein
MFPYHTTQPHSLTLRTQCWTILSELPSLFFQFSSLSPPNQNPASSHFDLDSGLDQLALKADNLFNTITAWVEEEREMLCPAAYADVISGVMDCSVSMALVSLSKMMASLQRVRSLSSSPESLSSTQNSQAKWEDPEMIEHWKNRAVTAFAFVQGESMVAAKVLDFGMEQLSLLGAKAEMNEMQERPLKWPGKSPLD